MNHIFRFSTSGNPTKHMPIGYLYSEFNRGQWPQVTLVDLEPHLAQCQGSHPVMYWHQSHQLSPCKSIATRQVAFTHDFAEILRRLLLLWRHNFVTWPDPTNFFHQKFRKGCPISYGKFQHDPPNGVASSSEKLMGGGVASTPPDRARVKGKGQVYLTKM